MRRVVIESPLAGDLYMNHQYALRCMRDSLSRGEAPFASHLLYTLVLDDELADERALGMTAGAAWSARADLCAVYTDRGISPGMRAGIEIATASGVPVVYRSIGHRRAGSERPSR